MRGGERAGQADCHITADEFTEGRCALTQQVTAGIGESAERGFWENDLQMCLDPWLDLATDRNHMRGWVEGLTKRQLRVLCTNLGLDGNGRLQDQREALLGCDGQLTPYYLVERFAFRRSKFATADYAAVVLPSNTLDECRIIGGHHIDFC